MDSKNNAGALALAALLTACAPHWGRPPDMREIPPVQNDAFWTCPIVLEKAEANLVRASYSITRKTESYVQTDWHGADVGDHINRWTNWSSNWRVRITATDVDGEDAITWSAMLEQQLPRGQVSETRVGPTIRNLEIDQPSDREFYNSLRRDVCGGPDFFKEPPPEPK